MASGIRQQFYQSKRWENTAKTYKKSRGGLCERCLANGIVEPGAIVHHKIYLTDQNLNNLDISLSFDNLELLCRQCHADEHATAERKRKKSKRWDFTESGELMIVDETPPGAQF